VSSHGVRAGSRQGGAGWFSGKCPCSSYPPPTIKELEALLLRVVTRVRRCLDRAQPTDDAQPEPLDQLRAEAAGGAAGKAAGDATDATPAPGWGSIAGFGAIGLVASVVGGHAVGDFADLLVEGLAARGYAEMLGALLLSVFASPGAFAMIVTSHRQRMYDVALASAAGQVSQVPFVVLRVSSMFSTQSQSFGYFDDHFFSHAARSVRASATSLRS